MCANANCKKKVSRRLGQFKKSKSGLIFCSTSCAAIVNNLKKRRSKTCPVCAKKFYGGRKYCSNLCRSNALKSKLKIIKVPRAKIINEIKKFYKNNGRIPTKKEVNYYKAARLRFGTWNKAIEATGFEPNPVLFAKKHIANDGHKCNSLAEKIIDDWLYTKKLNIKEKSLIQMINH